VTTADGAPGSGGDDGAGASASAGSGAASATVTGASIGAATGVGAGGAPAGAGGGSVASGVTASGSVTTTGAGPSAASATATSSAASGGGPVCDNQKSCYACVSCSETGPCQGYVAACAQNPECVEMQQCYALCFEKCTEKCWIPHPMGHKDYLAMAICIYCDNCFNDCKSGDYGCPEQ
jgi:hypothetical protein